MNFKKKLAVVLSAATVLMSAVPTLGVSGEDAVSGEYIKGDIDLNGTVGASDIVAVSNYLTGKAEMASYQLTIADMNDDGVVNVFDQVLIRRTALEIREIVKIPAIDGPIEPTTEEPSYEVTEAPTEPVTEPATEAETDPTEPVTEPATEAETDPTEPATEPATEAETDPTEPATEPATEAETDPTEPVTTVVIPVTITEATKPATSVAADVTEEATTAVTEEITTDVVTTGADVVTTAETEVVTTTVTEPVTTAVTTTEAAVTYAFPYEVSIDPDNTSSVDGVKFAVSADEGVVYNGAVQFFVGDENFDVEYSSSDAVDGVITVNTPDEITDKTAVTLIKICKYWQSDDEASVVLTDVKAIIGGVETDPYVEPAKTADSSAVMMGSLGTNQFWSADELPEGSAVPTVTEDRTYTAKLVLNEATDSVQFLIIGLDGLRGEDFADLAITVDEIKVDEKVLATADLSAAVINTGYKEGAFDGTRIYLTDTWTDTGAAAVPTGTAIAESIEVTFTVSGIN